MGNTLPNVVNMHFIDYCNYTCCYCFVKKENRLLSLENAKLVIDNINEYFKINRLNGRINLVGGETFLCSYLQDIIDYIHSYGIEVSIVTNASLLTEDFIISNKNKLSTIGISVDSLIHETNMKIGRSANKKTMSEEELTRLCRCIKDNGIKLKINHCVSKLNMLEDISEFIKMINPDRFKIFQMTVVDCINGHCKCLQVNDSQFKEYCKKYDGLNPIIETEEDMKASYLMIDSVGDVFINKDNGSIGNAIVQDLNRILKGQAFDQRAFNARYEVAA